MAKRKESCFNCITRNLCKVFSWACIVGLYILIGLHFYAWAMVVCPLLKKRLGTQFGMIWAGIGMIFLYNIIYNHMMAMFIKAGSVSDMKMVERMRIRDK